MITRTAAYLLLALPTIAFADDEMLELELQRLMSMEVDMTSAMKRAQPINTTPASLFVLEQSDIKLSGYTTIPELLKLIPGIDARRIDNNQWAVSVRSAASRFNSNIMVMIDGRNVGEANVNGIYWEELDYPVDDIERIELVRGAGGSLWGNSANNGILNIITKHSVDTQGVNTRASFGNVINNSQQLRYGGTINDQVSYRLFAKHRDGDKSQVKTVDGESVLPNDFSNRYTVGGQFDYQYATASAIKAQYQHTSSKNGVTVRGVDLTTFGLSRTPETAKIASNAYNFRMDHSENEDLKLFAQVSFSDFNIRHFTSETDYQSLVINTVANYQWQQGFFSTGIDYERNKETVSYLGQALPLDASIYGVFFQNESYFFDEQLKILIGTRWDHINVYDTEASPNIRFNYTLDQNHSMWGAYSRGNRIMANSKKEQELYILVPNNVAPAPALLVANTKNTIERASTVELGYRYQNPTLNINISAFDSDYDSLFVGTEQWSVFNMIPALITHLENSATGQAHGVDMTASWQPNNDVKLVLGYSYIDYEIDTTSTQIALSPDDFDNTQLYARLNYQANDEISSQFLVKQVSKNESFHSPSFLTIDAALHWQVNEQVSLSLSGQNLSNSSFVEFPLEGELFNSTTALGRHYSISANMTF